MRSQCQAEKGSPVRGRIQRRCRETESETESGGETAESTEEASGETGRKYRQRGILWRFRETIELDAEEPVETESAPYAVKDAPPAVSGSNVRTRRR